ncbi:MAG: tRNA (guanosine(46)-N7)-methyltransferase TrmB [Candidatus Cloacimonadales bacterium]|nr:tRNA (guanosine(46)-N7)-methyltransferase TrmB [Candidatus Cloacimonadales bacterium]
MDKLFEKSRYFQLELSAGQRLDFPAVFGNAHPVHLEIGSGRGEFLLQKAISHPEINFLALELKEKRIRTILRQLDPETHKNVRLIKLFVNEHVTDLIPAGSFQTIYIIHPDPWPKKRHNRRRLIQPKFIDVLHLLLQKEGIVKLSTDHEDYAGWIVRYFLERKDFSSIYKNGFTRNTPSDHVETFFEKVKREEGFPPFYMEFRKVKI